MENVKYNIIKDEKSPMSTWAEREVELAIAREKALSGDTDDWEYGAACYESALKAFQTLLGDGHSGMSIGFTRGILDSMIDGRALTPVEDIPEDWNLVSIHWDQGDIGAGTIESELYQSKRMSNLFKTLYRDGSITYSDNGRAIGIEVETGSTFYNKRVMSIVDELYPITMPYFPKLKPIKVYCETFLVDKKFGDFDTRGILYLIDGDGNRVDINRYSKETKDGWVDIKVDEYKHRKSIRIDV